MIKFIITIAIIVFISSSVFAQDAPPALVTDRPDQTESPLSVPVKSLQIETGIIFSKDRPSENNLQTEKESFEIASTLFRYGFTESLELRLSGGFISESINVKDSTNNSNGIGGVKIGTKIHLFQENNIRPETAVIVDFGVPIGNIHFVSKKVIPGFLFTMGHTLSDFFSFSYNLGGVWPEDGQFSFIYSAVFGMGISDKFGVFIEGYGFKPLNIKNVFLLDTGMTYLILPNLQLDTSAGISISEAAADWFLNLGFSIRIPH